jgi:hypothetical protein
MQQPRLTDKVRRGLWLIVARSATVMQAESPDSHLPKDERECVLAASRYADSHWKPGVSETQEVSCA